MEIKFQFTPTKKDYIESARILGASSWVIVLVTIGFAAITVYFGNHVLHQPDLRTRADWYSPFALLLSAPLFAMFVFFFQPVLSRMVISGKVESNEHLRDSVAWDTNSTRIITTTKVSEIRLDWSLFSKAIEFGPYYMLIHRVNEQSFFFVPKRAFESPNQENAFRALLEQKFGKLKDEYFKKKTLPLRLQWGGVALQLIVMLGYWVMLYLEMYR